MIRILHAADLHLDSPFQGLDREKALQRRREQRDMLQRIAELVREREVDIALFAGDLFDSSDPFSDTAELVGQVLSSMPVPVFAAPGNHDWYSERSPWARMALSDNVHVFTKEEPECISLPDLGIRVWGSAFTAPSRSAPLAGFEAEKDGDLLDIMVLHGQVGDPSSPYGPITEDELLRSGMDYVALGHVHSFSGSCRAGSTYYAWPGCPEGRGFDECGAKGVLITELDRDSCRTEFVPMEGRRYERISLDITETDDIAAAVDAAVGDRTGDIYRISLTGQTATPPDMEKLRSLLERRFFALDLRDATGPCRDIWEGRDKDTLRGLFLIRLWDMMEQADNNSRRERVIQAVRWGLRAMENGDELPL